MSRLISVAAAAGSALLIWLAGLALGISPTVHFGSTTVTVGLLSIVAVVALAGIAAWGVDLLVRSSASQPRRAWLWICLIALFVSLLGPMTQAANIASATVLLLMHAAVAVVVGLGFIWRRSPSCVDTSE